MSFDWEEYHKVAVMLSESNDSSCSAEARHRAAISRAYYAALNTAKQYVIQAHGVKPRRGNNSHKWVLDQIETAWDPRAADVHQKLNKLRRLRTNADYKPRMKRTEAEMRTALRLSIHVVSTLKSIWPKR